MTRRKWSLWERLTGARRRHYRAVAEKWESLRQWRATAKADAARAEAWRLYDQLAPSLEKVRLAGLMAFGWGSTVETSLSICDSLRKVIEIERRQLAAKECGK